MIAIHENSKKKMTDKDDKVEEVKDDHYIDIEDSLARDPTISMSNGELPLIKEYMSNAGGSQHPRRTMLTSYSAATLTAEGKRYVKSTTSPFDL